MSQTPDASHPTRRQQRLQRAHRRRALAGGAVAAVLVVAAALVVTDTFRFPGQPEPRFADASSGGVAGAASGALPSSEAPRSLSPEDPLRLWVGGDSLAGALGPALGTIGSDTGVVRTWYDSHSSSGLVDETIVDWESEAADQMVEINPEAVVFIMGANDHAHVTDDGSWRDDYARRTGEMMDILGGDDGRAVYWVGSPILGDDDMSERVAEVNAVFVEEADERANVVYVDAWDLFSVNGSYAQAFENADGEVVDMRDGDGVHLTGAGAEYLAETVFALMDQTFSIEDFAVPGASQPVEVSGSEPRFANPGSGANDSSSSSSYSGSTTATSTPQYSAPGPSETVATAPPPTDPPPTEPAPSTTAAATSTTASTAPASDPGGGNADGGAT